MVSIAAIAALIGEPDIATWEATTDPASVREGRIPDSLATSAITGRVENTMNPVPAIMVIDQVIIGAIILIYLGLRRMKLPATRTR